ncbi:hypothetical protein HUN58_16515 [Curtobacterium sp. Csp1]|uniref:hypothetical protein n=1 Tax=Curtobacterium sp. Csp1 TaxID=2495429 RepID=UPI001597C37E|nr:hypothetical protein [Curtobacterium sp. Csp1]QKS21319.1 hypothetical protein HUN58_16515 [Curtobacterium sp. Csp1]
MSDLIRSTSTWWAQSSKHARRTAIGTTAIVLVLGLITWTVWVSPSGPVSTAVSEALGVTPPAAKKVSATELQTKLTAAQKQVWALQGKLDSSSAQAGSRAEESCEERRCRVRCSCRCGREGRVRLRVRWLRLRL